MSNQKQKDGGAAFPCPRYVNSSGDTHSLHDKPGECGMTLRDYFAAAALQGELAAQEPSDPQGMPSGEYAKLMAGRAYTFADAMLAARKGGAS